MGDSRPGFLHRGEDPGFSGDVHRQSLVLILRTYGEPREYDAGNQYGAREAGHSLLHWPVLLLRVELPQLRDRRIEGTIQVSFNNTRN